MESWEWRKDGEAEVGGGQRVGGQANTGREESEAAG